MQTPGIFEILEYSEPLYNYIPSSIQNPAIFTKIGKPCGSPANTEPRHIDDAGIIRILKYLKPDRYSE